MNDEFQLTPLSPDADTAELLEALLQPLHDLVYAQVIRRHQNRVTGRAQRGHVTFAVYAVPPPVKRKVPEPSV